MRYSYLFIFCCLLNYSSKAQLTSSDSSFFKSVFADNWYSNYSLYPGNWYIEQSPVGSLDSLYLKIDDVFKFRSADFENAYDLMVVNNSFSYDVVRNGTFNDYFNSMRGGYKQLDPLVELEFNLNNKNATSYATYTPASEGASGNQRIAFFVIPGSEANQTTDIIRGEGYHNTNCYVSEHLKAYGDVFIHTKPVEDYRGIYWNGKKLNTADYVTPGSLSFLYTYLLANDKPYGVNYLIECFAFIKYLNQHYDKVVLLGCSQGGYAAMLTAFNTDVDAALIASGFTTQVHDSASYWYAMQQIFGSAVERYTNPFVKECFTKANTQFLLTYAYPDLPAYITENQQHLTQSYLQNLPNIRYYYNYSEHSFPPCTVLDSFVLRVQEKPKPLISLDESVCINDSLKLKIWFKGVESTYTFDLYKDSLPIGRFVSPSDYFEINVSKNGLYYINNQDSNSGSSFISNTVEYKKVSFEPVNDGFDCSLVKNKVIFNVSPHGAYTVAFTKDNADSVLIVDSRLHEFLFDKGKFQFKRIVESNGCEEKISSLFTFDTKKPSYAQTEKGFDCNALKTKIDYTAEGKAPWKLYFDHDTEAKSLIIAEEQGRLLMENGRFVMKKLVDGNGCEFSINDTLQLNNEALSYHRTAQYYSCTESSVNQEFRLTGKSPWVLYFTKGIVEDSLVLNKTDNTISHIDSSYYLKKIVDGNACTFNINTYPLSYTEYDKVELSGSRYHCDSLKTEVTFSCSGKGPWLLTYTKNGQPATALLSDKISKLYLKNGSYEFIKAVGEGGCSVTIDKQLNINEQKPEMIAWSQYFVCDSNKTAADFILRGRSPWKLEYTNNGIPVSKDFSSFFNTIFLNQGNYVLLTLTDSNNCIYPINKVFSVADSLPSVLVTRGKYLCDSAKTEIVISCGGKGPWLLTYKKDEQPASVQLFFKTSKLYFGNGTYEFIDITGKGDCSVTIGKRLVINEQKTEMVEWSQSFVCDSNKTAAKFVLRGHSPWKLDYSKNGLPVTNEFTSFSNTLFLMNGDYKLLRLVDSNNCVQSINRPFIVSDSLPSLQVTEGEYLCDSGKTKVNIVSVGRGPLLLSYKENDELRNMILPGPATEAFWSKGAYHLMKVTDTKGCSVEIDRPLILKTEQPSLLETGRVFLCESMKTQFDFSLTGTGPWTLRYVENEKPLIKQFSTSQSRLFFANGNYHFTELKDSNNCSIKLDNDYVIKESDLSIDFVSQSYNCDSNLLAISIASKGAFPAKLFFERDHMAMDSVVINDAFENILLNNGDYRYLAFKDNRRCIVQVDTLIHVENNPTSFKSWLKYYDCISGKGEIGVKLTGNTPFSMLITNKDSSYTYTTDMPEFTYSFLPGGFSISHISDSRGCVLDSGINVQGDSYSYKPTVYLTGQKVSTDNSGRYFLWYFNDVLVDSSDKPYTTFKRAGFYRVNIYTFDDCFYRSKDVYLTTTSIVSQPSVSVGVYPNPFREIISVYTGQIGPVSCFVYDMHGKSVYTKQIVDVKSDIHMGAFPNGIYIMVLIDEVSGKLVQQFKLSKQAVE